MSEVDEKKLLEIEKIKQDIQLDMKKIEIEQKRIDEQREQFSENHQLNMRKFDIELSKKHYEAWRVALYGIAVGAGGTFVIAKTLQLLGA